MPKTTRMMGWKWVSEDLNYLGLLKIHNDKQQTDDHYNVFVCVCLDDEPPPHVQYRLQKIGGPEHTVTISKMGHSCTCPHGKHVQNKRRKTHCRHVAAICKLREREFID